MNRVSEETIGGAAGQTRAAPPAVDANGRLEIAWLVLLFAIRLALLASLPGGLSGDGFSYTRDARTILSSGRLPLLRVQPHGYPALIVPILALFGDNSPRAIQWIQIALDLFILLILVWWTCELLGGARLRWIRRACCVALMVQPFTATMVSSVYTEQFCQFFLFLGVCSLARANNSKTGGGWPPVGVFLLSAAGLLRSELHLLGVFLVALGVVLRFHRENCEQPVAAALLRNLRPVAQTAAVWMAAYLALPLAMLAWQYSSTRELGLVKREFIFDGYETWMRTWFATAKQHDRNGFGIGKPDWPGFDLSSYPSRAFDSADERSRVSALLDQWYSAGYSAAIDGAFMALSREKSHRHYLRHYVVLPVIRGCHFWVNVDGAQVWLIPLHLKRPVSTLVVAAVTALRFTLLGLALFGLASLFRRSGPIDEQFVFDVARLGAATVVARTLLLAALGPLMGLGLMEIRFVSIVWPFVLLLFIFGVKHVAERLNRRDSRAGAIVAANADSSGSQFSPEELPDGGRALGASLAKRDR